MDLGLDVRCWVAMLIAFRSAEARWLWNQCLCMRDLVWEYSATVQDYRVLQAFRMPLFWRQRRRGGSLHIQRRDTLSPSEEHRRRRRAKADNQLRFCVLHSATAVVGQVGALVARSSHSESISTPYAV